MPGVGQSHLQTLEVVVSNIAGVQLISLDLNAECTIEELKMSVLHLFDSINLSQLRVLVGSRICKDKEQLSEVAVESSNCVFVTLVVCAPDVSIAGHFTKFQEDWQIVPTAEGDQHGTDIYSPTSQQVTIDDDGHAVLSCRGRIATRREVRLTKEDGALRISGKFMYMGNPDDFLSIVYGVRALHTAVRPHGELDDLDAGIYVALHQGRVVCSVAGRSGPLGNFWFMPNAECGFGVTIDPVAGFVTVDLQSSCCECSLSRKAPELATVEFPGHYVVFTNRELDGCSTALWDVEVTVGGAK